MKRKATPIVLLESGGESGASIEVEGTDISSGSDWDANSESEEAFDEEAEESDAEESEGGVDEVVKKSTGRKDRKKVQVQEPDANLTLRRRNEPARRRAEEGNDAGQAGNNRASKRKRKCVGKEDDSDEETLATRRQKLKSGRLGEAQTGGAGAGDEGRMLLRPRCKREKVRDDGGRGPVESGTDEDEQTSRSARKKREVVKPRDKFLVEKWTVDEIEEAECEASGSLDSFLADDDEVEEGNEGLPIPAPLSSDDDEENEDGSSESRGDGGEEGKPESETATGVKIGQQRRGAKVDGTNITETGSTRVDKKCFMRRRRRSVVDDDPEEEMKDVSFNITDKAGKESEEVVSPRKKGRLCREGNAVKPLHGLTRRRGSMVEPVSIAERMEKHRKQVMHGGLGEEEGEEVEDSDGDERHEGSRLNSDEGLEDELGEEAFVVPDAEGRTYGYGDGESDEERGGEEGENEDEDARHPAGLKASRDDFRVYLMYLMNCILDPAFKQLARSSPDATETFDKLVRKAEEDVVVARSSVVSSKVWQPRVKVALQRRPLFTMAVVNTTHMDGDCDACKRAEHAAPHVLTLEGTPYDPNEVWEVQHTEEEMQAVVTYRKSVTSRDQASSGCGDEEPEMFHFGRHCYSRCLMYHVLHHYKPRLIARLREELKCAQGEGHRKDSIKHVLSNGRIVRVLYQNYKKMVLLANRFMSEGTTRFGVGQDCIIQDCQHLVEEIQYIP